MKFEIAPVRDVPLLDVARFLQVWHDGTGQASDRAVRRSPESIAGLLRWLLVDNPANRDDAHYGYCARDESGVVRGLTLNFPNRFVAGDRTLVGLCSGSYFVAPEVRTAGFYLFRRYLDTPGYDFYFATTCNASSSAIWRKVKGQAAPGSEREAVLPLRFEVMLPAFVGARFESRLTHGLAAVVGRGCTAVAAALPRGRVLSVEPCRDWDRLAHLAQRHRRAGVVTAERSAPVLAWRYGPASPNRQAQVCLFRDARGHEGWFAVGTRMLGRKGQVRAAIVLDVVWPVREIPFGRVLAAIAERAGPSMDAVYLPWRTGVAAAASRRTLHRTLEAPRVWGISPAGSTPVDFGTVDLVAADGDSGWSNRFENDSGDAGQPE